ncbi:MAG: FtsH protease activity modulator HflK [Oscillospiraceae bacterium]|nr:FtsH protease activity modulator HflK [Oscillospiraceae bacterium]
MNFNRDGWDTKSFKSMDPKSKKRMMRLVAAAVIIIIAIVLISSSYYMVSDKQQAVLTTFGKYTGTPIDAGLHFKIPFVQQAYLVDVNVSLKQAIGYNLETGYSIPSESKMITGDFNIVNVDFYVEYRISDPYKYLFASKEPDVILKNITQSRIRDIISSYKVDEILTTGKAEIQGKIKDLIVNELDIYNIGLELYDIKIQDAEPPTPEVIAAFKDVETAKQYRQTMRNQAEAYKNENIPKAQAEADKLLQNAEFLKQDRINESFMLVAMFNAMYEQYAANPNIHKQRMYYEMIENVLPGIRVYINAGSNNDDISMILPLDDFIGADIPERSGN